MATIAALNILLRAKTKMFDRNMKRSSRHVKTFSSTAAHAAKRLAMFGSALTAIGGGAMVYMVKRNLEAIDSTAKLSDRLGMATEDLKRFSHAASIMGASQETLEKSLEIFVRRLGEVRAGSGEAIRGLKMLGLNANDLVKARPAEAFKATADQISKLANQSDKAAAAYFLFGRQGIKLLNILNQGRGGISQLGAEADRLGMTFSRIDAAKVEAANDALTRAKGIISGMAQTLTIELSPFITVATNELVRMASEGEGMGKRVTNAFESVASSMAAVVDMGKGLAYVFHTIELSTNAIASSLLAPFALLEEVADRFNQLLGQRTPGPLFLIRGATQATKEATEQAWGDLEKLWAGASWGDKVQKTFARIRKEAELAAKNAVVLTGATRGMVQPLTQAANALGKVEVAIEKASIAIDPVTREIGKLSEQILRLQGISNEGLMMRKLYESGVPLEQIAKNIFPLVREIKSLTKLNVLGDFADQVREMMKTSGDMLREYGAKLQRSVAAGLLSKSTALEALARRRKDLSSFSLDRFEGRGQFHQIDIDRIPISSMRNSAIAPDPTRTRDEERNEILRQMAEGIQKLIEDPGLN